MALWLFCGGYFILSEKWTLRLLSYEWFRRFFVRQGLKRVLRCCWENRADLEAYRFVGSRLSRMSRGLCSAFRQAGLFSYSETCNAKIMPEFGTRVSEFGGCVNRGFWWDYEVDTASASNRVEYLCWLCSCYDIDMGEYFEKLAR